jgi:undecaprenyl-diphosphatase
LLYWINSHHTGLLDQVMVFASGKFSWFVFYLFLLYLIVKKYNKRAVFGIVFIALAITLADQTSVHLFKNVFLRLRPCHQPGVMEQLRMITGCGGQYGFVSSHAANSFALVGFITPLFKKRWVTIMMVLWGLLVIYSRVYLGVHYPVDVLAGSVVGFLSGYLMVSLFFVTDKNFGHLLGKNANP